MNPSDAQAMTNAELDAAYAAYYDAGRGGSELAILGTEIAGRLASVQGFVSGLFGHDQFPLYSERLAKAYGVSTQAASARQAVSDSAANVASKITFGVGALLSVAALIAIAVILIKVKK